MIHSGTPKSGPWLLEASAHQATLYTEDDFRYGPSAGTRPVVVHPDGRHQELDDWVRQAKFPKSQRCEYCKDGATKRIIHSEGMAYIPVCERHLGKGKDAAAKCVPFGDPDPSNINRVEKVSIHSGQPKSGPWLLEASRHEAVALPPTWTGQPGDPMAGQRPPKEPSLDPTNDPMGRLNNQPYSYGDMVNNLVSHYHGSDANTKKQGRLWYKAAHDLFHKLASDTNTSPERSVATGAAFSPLTDWGDNIKHASHFMLNYGQPGHNENDWRMAHLHPQALQSFRDENGRDPSESPEDLNRLADLHSGLFRTKNNLDDPNVRAEWASNIQHHGMDKILADHQGQVFANKKKGYNPVAAMRDSGIPTLGNNISSAKRVFNAPEDPKEFWRILGGPKVGNFANNILDPSPIDKQGYYQHPNGDWTQNADLGGTIDAHHMRAASMPHGGWVRKGYHGGSAGIDPTDPYTYDVFNRGLLDATKQINAGIADPRKHLLPKQVQAIIWLKHKQDNDRFKRMGIDTEGQVRQPVTAALDPQDWVDMPPLWRQMFHTRQAPDWVDLLSSWVGYHSPESDPDEQLEQHEQERMGPHPHEASRWYISDRVPTHMWYLAADSEVNDEDKYKSKVTGPSAAGDAGGYGSGNSSWSGGTDPHAAPMSNATFPTEHWGPSSGGGGAAGGSAAAPVSYTPSGGSKQWEQQVDLGLQRHGLPLSLAPQVEHQIDTESSGNPNAINNWDSNAQAGHPSQGLLQTIPSTFNEYHLPGDSMSITDPQANIDSAIGYAQHTYGPSLMNNGNGMGSGHGY